MKPEDFNGIPDFHQIWARTVTKNQPAFETKKPL